MWKKMGLIYNVNGIYEWNKSHAQVPVVDVLEDRLRIYYATRSQAGKSNISFIEVEKNNPSKIIFENKYPLFDFGEIGLFDDSGLMPSSIVSVGEKIKYLYYIGWTTRVTVPYHNSIGLAISTDDGITFKKSFQGPIITINNIEPYFSGTAFVLFDDDSFKMWYLSCVGWEIYDHKPEPLYNIKYSESKDGINWAQTGKIAIPLYEDEGGLVSASVMRGPEKYYMWYGKRKKKDYRNNKENSYRIGYAESENGIDWQRKDELAGINVSPNGWDSEMISYPYVVSYDNKLLMFYNGNCFGKTGFGCAIRR
jgi:hypothetical protein